MKLKTTFTVLYCPVTSCDHDCPFYLSKELIDHLNSEHSIQIYESESVEPFLDQYLDLYKSKLTGASLILGGVEDVEDAKHRTVLHTKFLNSLLEMQQFERSAIYKKPRMCLFCSVVSASLPELFAHMFQEHHFNIGLLDNLIFVDTFLNELEEMTKFKKECLYCREQFRNGTCLRKHMKSKRHFKIDGKDERWDRFYLVNYVNFVKVPVVDVADADEEVDAEDAWDDLTDEIDSKTQCLFCEEILASPESTFKHMKTAHSFDLKAIQRQHQLKFYDTMKLVNYFRHCQQHAKPPSIEEVNQIPDPSLWNRPEFYFPVYDEDPLLTAIGDAESDTDNEQLGIGDVDSLTEDLKNQL